MKVVLVALYDVHSFAIRTFHSLLERNGHQVISIFFKNLYINEEPNDFELIDLVNRINRHYPDLVGFSIRSPFFPLYKKIAPYIEGKVIVGGHHATVCPEELLPYADYVCVGEGEKTLLILCNRMRRNKPLTNIPNLWFKNNGVVVKGKKEVLDEIPKVLPKYSSNYVNEYIDADPEYESTERIAVLTTRGCFFDCSFCYNQTLKDLKLSKVKRRSAQSVLEEIIYLQSVFKNLKEVVFADNVFTWGRKWLDEFLPDFKLTGLKFRCFGHISLVDKEILQKIKDAGCHMITFGIQSGSEFIREKILNRPEKDLDIIKASKVIADIGFNIVRYDLIDGLPYYDTVTELSTKNLLSNMAKPFIVRRFNMMHFPKTKLTKELLSNGLIKEEDVQGKCTTSYREWMKEEQYGDKGV